MLEARFNSRQAIRVAIACGGTGGHLFPGMAVGDELVRQGAAVTLLISSKTVDQEAARAAVGMRIETMPAVGLTGGQRLRFVTGLLKSRHVAGRLFRAHPPQAVLAMGGFTAAPAVWAGRACGAATFLHESNAIPGRANRWLARVVDQAFVAFPGAAGRLSHPRVVVTGTPVRSQFGGTNPAGCRRALGLDPERPVWLIVGGSQGARNVNELVLRALPAVEAALPELQIVHLCGPSHFERVTAAYRGRSLRVMVRPFLTEMELALGAATVAVSRAGGSSLAELALMQVPAILIPYPVAADDHQRANAAEFASSGAARVLDEREATGERLARGLIGLIESEESRAEMRRALCRWQTPRAGEQIAECLLRWVREEALSKHAAGDSLEEGGGPDRSHQRDCVPGGVEGC